MNKSLTEILEPIFRELLKDPRDGFSALLVSRKWCKIMIPLIWENPYAIAHRFNHYKVIRTLLSTLDNDSRSLLIENGIDLSLSPPGALFDYAPFIRDINYDYIYKGIKNYIFSEYEDETFNIKVDSDDEIKELKIKKVDFNDEIKELKIKKVRLMFQQICALILNKSKSIKTIRRLHFSSPLTKDLDEIEDEINMIPFLPGANECLQDLYGIHISGRLDFTRFQTGLSQTCKNMTLIKINCESMDASNSLAALIQAQNKLTILMVEFSKENLFVPVIESLDNHKGSLEYLSIKTCDFNFISDKALKVLMSCNKLEILNLLHCTGLDDRRFLPLSTAFPLLRKFTFQYKNYYLLETFLIGIIKTANRHLGTFTLDCFTPKIVEAMLEYATEFTSCEFGRDQFSSSEELSEKYMNFKTKYWNHNKNFNLEDETLLNLKYM